MALIILKHIECISDNSGCSCFSSIVKHGMVCNSGIYKIKLKIDTIYNGVDGSGNMIGLTTDNFGNGSIDLGNDGSYDWVRDSVSWIGWSARDKQDDVDLPNGLYCGCGKSGRAANIFRRSGFKCKSRNGKYSDRLPVYRSGDIVVLIYNSDLGQLSFELFKKKEKSNNNNKN